MTLLFEHPLNNQYRSYLRLEALYNQVEKACNEDRGYFCFYPLFALSELFELCDFRPDIFNDIDHHLKQLNYWMSLPEVNHELVTSYIKQLEISKKQLAIAENITEPLKKKYPPCFC